MTFIRLATSKKFLVLSTAPLTPAMKSEIDILTQNGALIEAVLGTNPFHGDYFTAFYEAYPNAAYFGTPRHIRNNKVIPWAGCVGDEKVLGKWKAEGVEMRIPAGCEFDAPVPETTNHFSGVVVLHRESKTVICDDCFTVTKNPGFILANVFGKHDGEVSFHMSLKSQALHKTPTAAKEYYDWVIQLCKDWDFDNMATAHGGVLLGGSKEALLAGLQKAKPGLIDVAVKNGGVAF
ncbi:hypothetical protein BCR33DRAFT_588195 [Rhizoclosmatium globosum]|uniref:Metallo-beta-lactamase domain-containing protein n=1 Tax=Rhizoclosmatium globosum TaxID=329046 RepID=A0A1Y2B2L2_9FUNG|nr:hypothetical protein BCR33DRAFT_588195 [Rhizoclosmatium globosum]|eukprot:ORY29078.1 hypothetical protein BCR33DRAFT_588195 [Rhizoclosmatium globosum]